MKKKEKKIMICDFCGSYWTPSKKKADCGICGAGSKIEMGGKFDTRQKERKLSKKL